MRLVHLPNLKKKTLDTMSHTFLSVWHALFGKYDIYMVFNAANSFFLLPLRLAGKNIAINTDGLEWKRSKWGFAGKTYYKIAEKVACLMANRLVSDSKGMRAYYKDKHGMDSTEIAYGAPIQSTDSLGLLRKWVWNLKIIFYKLLDSNRKTIRFLPYRPLNTQDR